MTKLTRSKERVASLGEVFTPDHIVAEMHAQLSDKDWADHTLIYLEPTCGNGQFLVQAIAKKLEAGLSEEEAANTTFGMDLMPENVQESRFRVLHLLLAHGGVQEGELREQVLFAIVCNNIFQADTLKFLAKGSDGLSLWDKKKFLYGDPTGNGMVKVRQDLVAWVEKTKADRSLRNFRKWRASHA